MKMPRATDAATARLEELAPEGPDVSRRRMFGQPTVFINGNMFLGTFGGQVFLRLSTEDRAKAIAGSDMALFEPMPGRPMSEYVVLPEKLLSDRRKTVEWVQRGLAYARSLPPKRAGEAGGHRKRTPARSRSS